MRILLYGSSYVTELVERALFQHHIVTGHVPCKEPAFPGQMQSPVREQPCRLEDLDYDLALSVFFDQKVRRLDRAFNLHPGLLPRWGGCNILYHTLVENATEQGVTFHRMTERFDEGGYVLKGTYPVFTCDRIVDLYARVCAIAPGIALAGIELARRGIWADPLKPTYYPRELQMMHPHLYEEGRSEILAWIRSQRGLQP